MSFHHRTESTSIAGGGKQGVYIEKYLFELVLKMCSDAAKVLLAETWSEDVDPTGWWMSEKLDGVR